MTFLTHKTSPHHSTWLARARRVSKQDDVNKATLAGLGRLRFGGRAGVAMSIHRGEGSVRALALHAF